MIGFAQEKRSIDNRNAVVRRARMKAMPPAITRMRSASPYLSKIWPSARRANVLAGNDAPASENIGVSRGNTEVNITQSGIPDAIPPEACYLGWQESLRNLARLVEPEINQ